MCRGWVERCETVWHLARGHAARSETYKVWSSLRSSDHTNPRLARYSYSQPYVYEWLLVEAEVNWSLRLTFLSPDKVERMTRFASRPPWRINNMGISLSLVTLQSKRCYNTKEKRNRYRARALNSWKAIFGDHECARFIMLIFLIACTLYENTVL